MILLVATVLTVQPSTIDAIDVPAGSAAQSTITLRNPGADTTLGSIEPDACDPGITADPTPADLPAVIATGNGHDVQITCAATAASTIRRCQFHARNNGTDLADFTILCVGKGTSALGAIPTSINFGDVPIGTSATQPITLTNTGAMAASTLAIQIADQAGDFKVNAPCTQDLAGCNAPVALAASGGQTTVNVSCTPTVLGPLSAQVFVVADNGGRTATPIGLTCNGVAGSPGPHVAFDKAALDMHGIAVDTTGHATIRVTSAGSSDLTISSITLASGFTTDWSFSAGTPCATLPCTLPAGQSVDVAVVFTPQQIGARGSTLQIATTDPAHPTTTIALDGTGLGATLALDSVVPATGIDFGTVPVGQSASFAIALRNDGNDALSPVMLDAMPPDALSFDNDTIAIPAQSTAMVTLTCTPTSATVLQSTLTVTAMSARSGTPISVPVKCTGVTGPLLATPSPIELGEIRTGDAVHVTTIQLASLSGTLAVTTQPSIGAPVPSGMSVGTTTANQITPAAPVSFDLSIDPQHDADLSSHLAVSAGGSTIDIPVTGRVVTAAVVAPIPRDLGSFCVDQPTTGSTFNLKSAGTAKIGLDAPAFAEGATSPFELAFASPSTYPYSLLAGQSASVVVTPRRQSAAGMQADTIVWATDVAGSEAPTTAITAEFINDGGAINPVEIDFAQVPIHTLPDKFTPIQIENCGAADITLSAPVISPPGGFHLDAKQVLPKSLAPAEQATIAVEFAPVEKGTFDATLTVTTTQGGSAQDLVVMLHGDGIIQPGSGSNNPPPPGDGGCCDAGDSGPGGAAALVVMCAAVLRRRRSRASLQ